MEIRQLKVKTTVKPSEYASEDGEKIVVDPDCEKPKKKEALPTSSFTQAYFLKRINNVKDRLNR